MKRLLAAWLAALLFLSACAERDQGDPAALLEEEARAQMDAYSALVSSLPSGAGWMETRMGDGDGRWEHRIFIPKFLGDSEAVRAANAEIRTRFFLPAREYLRRPEGEYAVSALAAADGTRVSLRVHRALDPQYGNDGEIWAAVYDGAEDRLIPAQEAMEEQGLAPASVADTLMAMLPDKKDAEYRELAVPYWYFDADGTARFIVTMSEDPEGPELFRRIFVYDPANGTLTWIYE